jgi:hypothetical protein
MKTPAIHSDFYFSSGVPALVSARSADLSFLVGHLFKLMALLAVFFSGCRSAIELLFASCGPAHIAGLVIAVVINAIKRVCDGWWLSDVGIERLKGVKPFRVDSDTSVLIVSLFRSTRIAKPVLHVLPRPVNLASALTVMGAHRGS